MGTLWVRASEGFTVQYERQTSRRNDSEEGALAPLPHQRAALAARTQRPSEMPQRPFGHTTHTTENAIYLFENPIGAFVLVIEKLR